MNPGDIVLIRFPRSDLQAGKLRPALVVAVFPGSYEDVLLAAISSRVYQAVPGFDEVIDPSEPDYRVSGLKVPSVVRLTRLASVEPAVIDARLGRVSDDRLYRIRQRLGRWLTDSTRTP